MCLGGAAMNAKTARFVDWGRNAVDRKVPRRIGWLTVLVIVIAGATGAATAQTGQGCWALDPCPSGFSCHPVIQKCYHSPRREGEPCMAGFGCGTGLTCEAGTQVCRAPGRAGDPCHATRPCGAGLTCEAGTQICRAPGRESDPCHATRPCGSGLTCEAGTQICRAPGRFEDPCHLTRPCGAGLDCQPGVQRCYHVPRRAGEPCVAGHECGEGFYCQAFLQKCAPKSVDFKSNSPCDALRVQSLQEQAKQANMVMTFSEGGGGGAGVFVTYESGVAYGNNGEFGCFATVCAGQQSDVNIGGFANFGIGNRWSDLEGWSVVTGQAVDTPFAHLGFQTAQVWAADAPKSASDFVKLDRLLGSSSGLSYGAGLAPVSLSLGMCYTALLDHGDPLDKFADIKEILEGWGHAGFAPERTPPALASAPGVIPARPAAAAPSQPVSVAGSQPMPAAPSVNQGASLQGGAPNLARGRRAEQGSSPYAPGGMADRAVDGNTDGSWNDGSVTHTDERSPYWQVDLGGVYDISSIRIWNRTDCCRERLNGFYILVSEAPITSSNPDPGKIFGGGRQSFGPEDSKTFTSGANARGRYVRIFLDHADYLSLAEVEVFGTPAQAFASGGDGPSGYTRCAGEGGSCEFASPTDIAYGANGAWVYRSGVTGRITFDNRTFGDPAPGVLKAGYFRAAAPSPPAPQSTQMLVAPPAQQAAPRSAPQSAPQSSSRSAKHGAHKSERQPASEPAKLAAPQPAPAAQTARLSSDPECQKLSDKFGIVAGQGFGLAPPEARKKWQQKGCGNRRSPESVQDLCQKMSNQFKIAADGSTGTADADVQGSFKAMGCTTSPKEVEAGGKPQKQGGKKQGRRKGGND